MNRYSLNRPMLLEQAQFTQDGAGGHATDWHSLGTHWTELSPGPAREVRGDIVPEGQMAFRIFLRSAPHDSPQRPRPGQRFRDGSRIFNIVAVSEADPLGAFLICHARERVPI
ncbi:head-tail adaptor protein [Pararhodobacter sp. SW119]|uniref:head-tail adaptor protein n=1 Tax=Pararhodobacter sp. SW119 TaxID=2780075 RepID=UPI001ADEE088|nr:head-tail adaptor protein [Pararhodobacter sp. SW119]